MSGVLYGCVLCDVGGCNVLCAGVSGCVLCDACCYVVVTVGCVLVWMAVCCVWCG
jgi:hypothetical protein